MVRSVVIATLILFSAGNSARAMNPLCDCSTQSFPKEDASCPKAPAKLKDKQNCFTNEYASPSSCEPGVLTGSVIDDAERELRKVMPADSAGASIADRLRNPIQGLTPIKPTAKNFEEVMNYLSCYREGNSKKNFCNFKVNLAPDILLAAESAGQPVAVTACRYMQESGFNPTEVSPKGAKGYNQFMDGTIKEMNNVIAGPVSKWRKQVSDGEAKLDALQTTITQTTNLELKVKYTRQYNRLRRALAPTRAKVAARDIWERAWAGTAHPPHQLTSVSSACKHEAFIAGEMYHVYSLYESNVLDLEQKDGQLIDPPMDATAVAILASAAYNNGPGGFSSHCSGINSLDQCIARYGKKHETRKHMESIRNCAGKNMDDDFKAMNREKHRTCGAYRCTL